MTATVVSEVLASPIISAPSGVVEVLGRYGDADSNRSLVVSAALDGSLLVVDQHDQGGDRRLVAHLHRDEPLANARLVAELYLADPDRRARPLTDDDWFPPADQFAGTDPGADRHDLTAPDGRQLTLSVIDGEMRWRRDGVPLSVRCVVATLEAYEPAVSLSEAALDAARRSVGTRVLRAELRRLHASPFVLNRGLREAVQSRLAAGETLALIARRCGHFIAGDPGRADTSWLARRCGLMAPPCEEHPTPWVHSDVLALIAREGLGVAPREVELA
jgi:hypothetical protein